MGRSCAAVKHISFCDVNVLLSFDTRSHVIDRKILGRDSPLPRHRIELKSFAVDGREAGLFNELKEFVRGDELAPIVGTFGQPTHHIFGADDPNDKAFGVPIQGRTDHQPT